MTKKIALALAVETKGSIKITGAMYDLATGVVEFVG